MFPFNHPGSEATANSLENHHPRGGSNASPSHSGHLKDVNPSPVFCEEFSGCLKETERIDSFVEDQSDNLGLGLHVESSESTSLHSNFLQTSPSLPSKFPLATLSTHHTSSSAPVSIPSNLPHSQWTGGVDSSDNHGILLDSVGTPFGSLGPNTLGQSFTPSSLTTSYEMEKPLFSSFVSSPPAPVPAPSSSAAKKGSKTRCNLDGCVSRVVKIVGDCKYCEGHYCSGHRLPESHACTNLQSCRQDSLDKLATKLYKEKCVADKI